MSVIHFLSYHNAVPIAFSVVLLGAGATFAATNPEVIYSEEEHVLSIDNTYLVNKDLASYSPTVQILTVTEDPETYLVDYSLTTVDVEDYVWKDVTRSRTMKVSKAMLGPYRDLGEYVTQQLKENIDEEMRRLVETQEIERKSVSQKVVATQYGGLIGKMLDASTETLPGYTPVVVRPAEPHVAAASESVSGGSVSTPGATVNASGSPTIQVLGNNPARVPIGSAYADLGAVITGPTANDRLLGIHVFIDDREVQTPSIDTTEPREWTIRYEAENSSGKSVAVRTVVVFDPYAAERAAQSAAMNSASTTEQTALPDTTARTIEPVAPSDTTNAVEPTDTAASSTSAE